VNASGRVAWFLGLQGILRFPRYPLAPSRDLFKLHNANIDHSEINSSTAPKRHGAVPVYQREAGNRLHSAVADFAPKPIMAAREYLPGYRSLPPRSQLTNGRVPLAAAKFSQAVVRSRAGMPKNSLMAIGGEKRAGFSAGRVPQLTPLFNVPGPAATARRQFAPIGTPLETQGLTAPTIGTSTRRNIERDYPQMSQVNFSTVNLAHSVEERFVDRVELDPPEPVTSDQDAKGQQRLPSTSTLHIDGAALGRWTVQHLARALGKPTTGMTGVDPRVTLPRTRVQPF
jgi:hypothetical protein